MAIELSGTRVSLKGKFSHTQPMLKRALKSQGAIVSPLDKASVLFAGEGSQWYVERFTGTVLDEASLMALVGTVDAPPPKAVTTEEFAGLDTTALQGKQVCLTGALKTFKRAELKKLLQQAGAKVTSNPTSRTDLMISGTKWAHKLRQGIQYGATVWTEGQLLMALEGADPAGSLREDQIPNGRNLSTLEGGKTGTKTIPCPFGELVLHWTEVPFEPHRRFLEKHGFVYEGDTQFLARLTLDGVELTAAPQEVHAHYGAESFRRTHFWECGTCVDHEQLTYDGQHGFNATPLMRGPKTIGSDWSTTRSDLPSQSISVMFEGPSYGSVCWDQADFWLTIDPDRKTYATVMHTAPNRVSPDTPFG